MKIYFFFLFLFSAQILLSQEICDNAIDDDSDGLVDLNDTTDCVCNFSAVLPSSIIPNFSFESFTNCPNTYSQLDYATSWQQATDGTSDYFNQCDYNYLFDLNFGFTDVPSPYPDGNGCAGFYDLNVDNNFIYKEYIGACLTSPLLAGVNYTLQLKIYTSVYNDIGGTISCNATDLDLTLFGTSTCSNFPLSGFGNYECPSSLSANWSVVASTQVNFVSSTWQAITISFTPTTNIAALILGPGCAISSPSCTGTFPGDYTNYFYVDQLVLSNSSNFNSLTINQSGLYCNNDIILESQFANPPVNPSYQWYKDGIAILGATSVVYNVPSGLLSIGDYQIRVIYDTNCILSPVKTISFIPSPTASFLVENECVNTQPFTFTNTSSLNTSISSIFWTFGDGDTSFADNPTHNYTNPGEYSVYLTITDDVGCSDDTTVNVMLYSEPTASFEQSYQVSCDSLQITFTNKSTNASRYKWYLNATEISDEENLILTLPFNAMYSLNLISFNAICKVEYSILDTLLSFDDYYQLLIPNVCTPNNDKLNDVFMIKEGVWLSKCTSYEIFDRWGKQLFNSSKKEPFFNGNDFSDGTYFYIIEFKGKQYNGEFTLLK